MSAQPWQLNRHNLTVIVLGALAYASLWALTQLLSLPNLLVVSLRPAVAIPLVCGLLWGPVVGFGVGFLGMVLGDFVVSDNFPIYWDVGAGLLGAVAGCGALLLKSYTSWRSYLAAAAWSLLAVYVSLDYTVTRQVIYESLPAAAAWEGIFQPALISNSVNALILVPILLWLLRRFAR